MSLAERLKDARNLLGKEQKEIADLLGISFRSWQDYELGKSVPGGKVFEALAKLGFNANWLLTGEGEKMRSDSPPAVIQLPDEFTVSEGTGKITIRKTSIKHDKEVIEIVDILEHDLPETKSFILKLLRGKKEMKEGLEGLGMKLKEDT